MSVARTMSITSDRNSRYSSLDKFCNMLQSSSLSILKYTNVLKGTVTERTIVAILIKKNINSIVFFLL